MTHTLDAALTSWVDSANDPTADFPIQNLALGTFRRAPGEAPRLGVAIGDSVLDVGAASQAGLLPESMAQLSLHALMSLPPEARQALRVECSAILRHGSAASAMKQNVLLAQREVEMCLPSEIGDYTDFYASVHHATNVGSMFRPDNPLLPNYKWVPIGYHGRASSVVVSGTPVRRPEGQLPGEGGAAPNVGPSKRLDYECELGVWVGPGNALGTPIPLSAAPRHIFGFSLLNDWSARDVQAWEYQPLGPFLAKNFATTVGAWVVTPEALQPFRCPLAPRADGDPSPLPYLQDAGDQAGGGLDITLEIWLQTARMRADGVEPVRLSAGNTRDLYWTPGQFVAHHTMGGCNLRSGDLLGSGTVSGPTKDSRGCLLELTWRGAEPIQLPGGEIRRFLEDGDEVIMRGRCVRDGWRSIGFGECRGRVVG